MYHRGVGVPIRSLASYKIRIRQPKLNINLIHILHINRVFIVEDIESTYLTFPYYTINTPTESEYETM